MPRGGWLREVRRWACCGLRRTGGPSPGFGAFSSSRYTVPLCWGWGPGHIAALWSCQRVLWLAMCDTLFACFSSPNIRHLWQTLKHHLAELEPLRNRLLALPFVLVWRRGRDCLAGEGAGSESC